jgi:hypothetical protein
MNADLRAELARLERAVRRLEQVCRKRKTRPKRAAEVGQKLKHQITEEHSMEIIKAQYQTVRREKIYPADGPPYYVYHLDGLPPVRWARLLELIKQSKQQAQEASKP